GGGDDRGGPLVDDLPRLLAPDEAKRGARERGQRLRERALHDSASPGPSPHAGPDGLPEVTRVALGRRAVREGQGEALRSAVVLGADAHQRPERRPRHEPSVRPGEVEVAVADGPVPFQPDLVRMVQRRRLDGSEREARDGSHRRSRYRKTATGSWGTLVARAKAPTRGGTNDR